MRETATNCQAKIEVLEGTNEIFKMKGRWANSTQIPEFAQHDQLRITLYPEPISIRSGMSQILDGIIQFPNDKVAYGWNNEAYFNEKFKTPAYELKKGKYRVIVTVSPQNGRDKSEEFILNVSDNYSDTTLMSK